MGVFDLILAPADTYWKKQYNAEKIRRQRAEANEKYATDTMDEQEKNLDLLTRRDVGQARAIEAMNAEILRLKAELEKARSDVAERDERIALLYDALHAERDARAALKTSQRLWDEKRQTVKEATA